MDIASMFSRIYQEHMTGEHLDELVIDGSPEEFRA